MRAIITGAGGQLGQELAQILPAAHLTSRSSLDITDEVRVWEEISRRRVDVVFHCAAMTDVDGCERNPSEARRVNALGTLNVARVCGALGIYLLAVSTDYVFAGRQRREKEEDTEPHPLSAYGRTKLDAEMAVRQCCPRHAVVRTSWLYGAGKRNFVRTVVERGVSGQAMSMVEGEISKPTWARDLAPALVQLAQRRAVGTFHITNTGAASRYEWAQTILRMSGLDPDLVSPVDEYPLPAPRPGFSALANNRARALGIALRSWNEALSAFLQSDPDVQSALSTRSAAR